MIDLEEESAAMELRRVRIPALRVDNAMALHLLLRLESRAGSGFDRGYSLRYWTEVARFVLGLLADQRFIPSIMQSENLGTTGVWQPWLLDQEIRQLLQSLHDAMPPIARATVDRHGGLPSSILSEAITALADATIRRALIEDGYGETLDAIEDADDPHAIWLRGLLGNDDQIVADGRDVELFRDVSRWTARLDESVVRRQYTLLLRLNEPDDLPSDESAENAANVDSDAITWRLSFHLSTDDGSGALIDAEDIWHRSAATPAKRQAIAEHPEEVLLSELARAARVCELLETVLAEPTPTGMKLSTSQAHTFLREHRPVLEESGIRVQTPLWWGRPSTRIGARLQLHTPDDPAAAPGGAGRPAMGLQTLVEYRWEISLGDQAMTEAEFRRLMQQESPLVRLRGQWVELLPEDRDSAKKFLGMTTSGQMTLLQALRQVSGASDESHGLTITGLDATGWFGELLNATSEDAERMTMLDQPSVFARFAATLSEGRLELAGVSRSLRSRRVPCRRHGIRQDDSVNCVAAIRTRIPELN
jgi:hypothetical protein